MTKTTSPRTYHEWRSDPVSRDEDAACAFGHHLMVCCRDEALAKVKQEADGASVAVTEAAVDEALHNMLDMLEGFFPLEIGDGHRIELALQVRVLNAAGEVTETREISPCKLDLPIGYWKWRDREFR